MGIKKGIRVGKVSDVKIDQENYHDSLLSAIARSSEELTSGKGWPEGVIDLMADLGLITGVSRVWIFQTIEVGLDYIIQDYPFEWAKNSEYVQLTMPKFNMFRSEVNNDEYRNLIESRKRGEWQSAIISQLEDCWLRDDLENQLILSMLTIPIMVEGKWWGTLGFDDCEREYQWSDVEISLLRTASFLISNAVMRDRLSAKRKQFEILQDVTESSSWEIDFKKSHFWCSSEIFSSIPGVSENIHLSIMGILRLIHPDDREIIFRKFREFVNETGNNFRTDLRIANQCGTFIWVEVIGKMSRDSNGKIERIAGIAVEILQRKLEEEELRNIAKKDPLTGISNRRVFDNKLSKLMNRYLSKGEEFSLLLIDIDNFKEINDKWGHTTGDKALKHFTAITKGNLRSSDIFSRIGGEEFAILIKDSARNSAEKIGERIRRDIETTPLNYEGKKIYFTVSIGCGELPSSIDVRSHSLLYKLTDYALYSAKNSGRNRLVTIDDLEISQVCKLPNINPAAFNKKQ